MANKRAVDQHAVATMMDKSIVLSFDHPIDSRTPPGRVAGPFDVSVAASWDFLGPKNGCLLLLRLHTLFFISFEYRTNEQNMKKLNEIGQFWVSGALPGATGSSRAGPKKWRVLS